MLIHPGKAFRDALFAEKPLQVVGTINAYTALLAEQAGFRALYVSGAGVANASYGLPDLGMTQLGDVLEDVRRITAATSLPVLVDADTGWGDYFAITRTAKMLERAGAAGLHLEDQIIAKRCGHRPDKVLVGQQEMVTRIIAAVDGRDDENFVIMARTDAFAAEGMDGLIARAQLYVEAGADMLFAEALPTITDFAKIAHEVSVPVLANMTEFGRTPLMTREALSEAGISLILYPLSAFRAMNLAAQRVYTTIRRDGTQASVLDTMQTREQLYDLLDYTAYEKKMDDILQQRGVL